MRTAIIIFSFGAAAMAMLSMKLGWPDEAQQRYYRAHNEVEQIALPQGNPQFPEALQSQPLSRHGRLSEGIPGLARAAILRSGARGAALAKPKRPGFGAWGRCPSNQGNPKLPISPWRRHAVRASAM